jgi:hypothetical protein
MAEARGSSLLGSTFFLPDLQEKHASTDDSTVTFDLVDFSSYEVRQRTPYLSETRLTLGEATWKRITRGMVEVLVGRGGADRVASNPPTSRPHRRRQALSRKLADIAGQLAPSRTRR